MRKPGRLIFVGAVLGLSVVLLSLAKANEADSDIALVANVTELNSSGVSGNATVSISDEGVRGRLMASNLVPGDGYTVWFFYLEGSSSVAGPGRFDSTVAGAGDVVFHGHVGGLQASSGAKIRLLIFRHPDLTALRASGCTAQTATNVARANNLLTPQCGSPVGRAEFTLP